MPAPLTNLVVLSALATMMACAPELTNDPNCGDNCDYLGEFPAINAEPKSVLFIPMSSAYLGLSKQKWQSDDVEFNRAISELSAMYRGKGVDDIVVLPRLQRWEDLDTSIAEFSGRTFDRVIIVGHGALDGPITRGEVHRTMTPGVIVEEWVLQPGLVRQYYIEYSEERFGAFIAENRQALLTQYDTVIEDFNEQVSDADQELFSECVTDMVYANDSVCDQSCVTDCATFEGQERNENCAEGCFNQCRDNFINEIATPNCTSVTSDFSESLDEQAYNSFSASLSRLTANDGLIFLGFCNAATDATGATVASNWGQRSYTDLIAATTGRHASGPIGSTSGQDIINRVTTMEKNRDQKYLYIAAPPK